MNIIITNDLSFYNDQGILTLNAKQYDNGRKFMFNIIDHDEPFDLTGCRAYLRILKADGTQFQGEECCSISGNTITVDTSVSNGDQILAASGINKCELHVKDKNNIGITTWNFNISVEARVHNGENLSSINSYDKIDHIISTETERIENEQNRKKNEYIRIQNENNRISNESERQQNEFERQNTFGNVLNDAKLYAATSSICAFHAKESELNSSKNKQEAFDSALVSESYAHGGTGTRLGEDEDNAGFYYRQAKDITKNIVSDIENLKENTYTIEQTDAAINSATSRVYRFMGSMADFSDLTSLCDERDEGDVYNVINGFTHKGKVYGPGTNVAWSKENGWDPLGGSYDNTKVYGGKFTVYNSNYIDSDHDIFENLKVRDNRIDFWKEEEGTGKPFLVFNRDTSLEQHDCGNIKFSNNNGVTIESSKGIKIEAIGMLDSGNKIEIKNIGTTLFSTTNDTVRLCDELVVADGSNSDVQLNGNKIGIGPNNMYGRNIQIFNNQNGLYTKLRCGQNNRYIEMDYGGKTFINTPVYFYNWSGVFDKNNTNATWLTSHTLQDILMELKSSVGAPQFVTDIGDGRSLSFNYSADAMSFDNFTWLAAWNGNTLQSVSKDVFLPQKGGTITGKLTVNDDIICLGDISGEDYGKNRHHTISLGHAGVDHCDFHEYGGVYNFYKTVYGKDTLLGKITEKGWEGNLYTLSGKVSAFMVHAGQLSSSDISCDTDMYIYSFVDGGKSEIYLYPGYIEFTTLRSPDGSDISVGLYNTTNSFACGSNNYCDLGRSSTKWKNIYAANGTIQTSDRNEKNTIKELSTEQAQSLIYGLKPSTYQMNAGTSGRTHWGIISQDIEELFEELGMTSLDFAGFIKSPKTERVEIIDEQQKAEKGDEYRPKYEERVIEGEYNYSLRYDEFIAPMIKVIQSQHEEIETLKQKTEHLEQQVQNLLNTRGESI